MMSRATAIARTIHAYTPGIKDLAGRIGCSTNLLYRAGLIGESGCDIAFGKVESLIDITRDFTVLDWFCGRFGFFRARPPRTSVNRMSEADAMSTLQEVSLSALHALREFFMMPSSKNRQAADRCLTDCLGTVEGIRRRVRSRNFNQLSLDF